MKLTATVAALTILAALAGPAQAATPWKRLTTVAGPPVAVGNGLVAVPYGAHGVAVVGPKGVVRTYDFGLMCTFANLAGGGKAVADCHGPGRFEKTVDLTTGEMATHASVDSGTDTATLRAVGMMWLSVFRNGLTVYRNLLTGQEQQVTEGRMYADLDAAALNAPLCTPVRRPAADTGTRDRFAPVTISGHTVAYLQNSGLYAWRCGRRGPQRLGTCAPSTAWDHCSAYAVSPDRVAWPTQNGVLVKNTLTGRRTALSGLPGTGTVTGVAFAAGRVYASRADGGVSMTRMP